MPTLFSLEDMSVVEKEMKELDLGDGDIPEETSSVAEIPSTATVTAGEGGVDDVGETIEEWKLGAIAPDLFHNPAYLRRRCSHGDSVVLPAATLDAGPDNGGGGVEATTDANDRKSGEGVAGDGDEGRDEDEPGGEDDAG